MIEVVSERKARTREQLSLPHKSIAEKVWDGSSAKLLAEKRQEAKAVSGVMELLVARRGLAGDCPSQPRAAAGKGLAACVRTPGLILLITNLDVGNTMD
jgi:hypothetical protein